MDVNSDLYDLENVVIRNKLRNLLFWEIFGYQLGGSLLSKGFIRAVNGYVRRSLPFGWSLWSADGWLEG